MTTRVEILRWAQRVIARKGRPAHELLEVPENAQPDQIQAAFHHIARSAHPDLHRATLTATEIDLVTSAYATVAGAYQELRTQTPAQRMMLHQQVVARTKSPTEPPPTTPPPLARMPSPLDSAAAPTRPIKTPSGMTALAPPSHSAQQMSSKALVYYRKAELALKQGNLRGAVLQLKLAIAADPTSGFLRTALAEVEAEARKAT